MKISIVTISYNQAQFLEQAILSVINQNYPDMEYIVVDAGSTDGSREIIKKYEKHIDKIIFESDQGPADGLNKGFSHATGDILGYLNSDDILYPHSIKVLANILNKNPWASVVSGHGHIINTEGAIQKKIFSHRFNIHAYAHGACVLVQQSSLFRKVDFCKVGGFNIDNHWNWDGELWVDLALAGKKFCRVHKYLSGFRIYPGTITETNNYSPARIKNNQKVLNKIGYTKPPSKVAKNLFWLITRISDPYIFLQKLVIC